MNKRIFEQARKNYIAKHPILYGGCSECLFSDQFFTNLLAVNKEVREKTQSISYDVGDSSCAFHAKVYNQIFGFKFPLYRDGNRYRIDCHYYTRRRIGVLHPVEGYGRCIKI